MLEFIFFWNLIHSNVFTKHKTPVDIPYKLFCCCLYNFYVVTCHVILSSTSTYSSEKLRQCQYVCESCNQYTAIVLFFLRRHKGAVNLLLLTIHVILARFLLAHTDLFNMYYWRVYKRYTRSSCIINLNTALSWNIIELHIWFILH